MPLLLMSSRAPRFRRARARVSLAAPPSARVNHFREGRLGAVDDDRPPAEDGEHDLGVSRGERGDERER